MLKRFGYNLDIQLREDYLHPPLKVPRGSSTEISPAGMEFIIRLFRKYDEVREPLVLYCIVFTATDTPHHEGAHPVDLLLFLH